MDDKITCFKLNWYNYNERYVGDTDKEEITIYRKKKWMVFSETNGYGEVCSHEIINIDKNEVDIFFNFLEKIFEEFESEYRVDILDGSEWEMRLWHGSHKIKKIRGTCSSCESIEIQLYIKQIEKYIRLFIEEAKSMINPRLF